MNQNEEEKDEKLQLQEYDFEQLKQSLEKTNFMGSKFELVKYQGFWCSFGGLKSILHFQTHFLARDSDIFVSSLPKSGTTWLISLLFCIKNRVIHEPPNNNKSLLFTHNPHELVYHLENGVYGDNPLLPRPHQLDQLPLPRLFYTHLPYNPLPESMKISSCKILYIARNPLDTFVSYWHFFVDFIKKAIGDEDFQPPSIEDFFEDFCQGRIIVGPYFEHVASYWKQSIEQPDKVLFLKYEDLKADTTLYVKKVAQFVGMSFSPEEENDGVIDNIIELCSIKSLKVLDVNKNGAMNKYVAKKDFFRKGEVGDWTNHLTTPMVDKINNLMEEKFGGTGLSFDFLPR